MGFVTPVSAWFRGPLADEAAGIAQGSALAGLGWFDPPPSRAWPKTIAAAAATMAACCGSC
jgi:hypothetical protein